MLRDKLAARLALMGARPDYERLAAEVLGIHGARGDLARRLVTQALLIEDRRDEWRRTGQRVCRDAPATPGVYVFRDPDGRALYVGKAVNLRRRLRAHFADRQWRALKPAMARVATVEWQEVGSEIEALMREATLIGDLQPVVNVQIGEPAPRDRRIPRPVLRDVILLLPSVGEAAAEIVAAAVDGRSLLRRASRAGIGLDALADRLWAFFHRPAASPPDEGERVLAPLVFSWLAGRGANSTRLDPHDAASSRDLRAQLETLLKDKDLFAGRIALRHHHPA